MRYIKEEQCIHTIHKWSLCKTTFLPSISDFSAWWWYQKKYVFDVSFFLKDIPIASDDIVVATSNHQGKLYLHMY